MAHRPTAEQRKIVTALAACMTQDEIATVIGITRKTLASHYSEELATGNTRLKAMAVGNVVRGVRAGDKSYTMFYLKTQCGWKEGVAVDIPNLPAPPAAEELKQKLTDEELRQELQRRGLPQTILLQ